MTLEEFKNFYRETRILNNQEATDEDLEVTKIQFKIDKSSENGPSMEQFIETIGKLRFRGTSGLMRMPKVRIQHLSPDRKTILKTSPGAKRARSGFCRLFENPPDSLLVKHRYNISVIEGLPITPEICLPIRPDTWLPIRPDTPLHGFVNDCL